MKPAILALADGTVFEGCAYGADGEAVGEVVFNTSMSGYQEILTDPSYKGQIVTMTYPLIGNYGVNSEDVESRRPWVEGFIIKEGSVVSSNWRASRSLEEYLRECGVVGIQGIDTRALTRHIRDHGSQEGVISSADLDPQRLIAKAKASPGLIGRDLVKEVCCAEPFAWTQNTWEWPHGYGEPRAASREPRSRICRRPFRLCRGSWLATRDSPLDIRRKWDDPVGVQDRAKIQPGRHPEDAASMQAHCDDCCLQMATGQ